MQAARHTLQGTFLELRVNHHTLLWCHVIYPDPAEPIQNTLGEYVFWGDSEHGQSRKPLSLSCLISIRTKSIQRHDDLETFRPYTRGIFGQFVRFVRIIAVVSSDVDQSIDMSKSGVTRVSQESIILESRAKNKRARIILRTIGLRRTIDLFIHICVFFYANA